MAKLIILALAIYAHGTAAISPKVIPTGSTAEKDTEQPSASAFIGRWSPDCERIGGIKIYGQERILIEVNSNQIYIRSHGKQNKTTLSIFLDGPDDLGRGGMLLPWDDFSREEPIAEITLKSETQSKIEWYGFHNQHTNIHEWTTGPDFLDDALPAMLIKCDSTGR